MTGRQLHLFREKKQRGVPIPRAKEYELHCMVADTLRRWCSPLWVYFHIPNGEKRDPVTAMRLKRMGVKAGVPDFYFAGPRNVTVWLELKRPGRGLLSDPQIEMAARLRACGHHHIVANDYETAIDVLRDFGIVTTVRVSA